MDVRARCVQYDSVLLPGIVVVDDTVPAMNWREIWPTQGGTEKADDVNLRTQIANKMATNIMVIH